MLKCLNWRRSAGDRDACRRRIEEAKVQVGLQRHRRRRRMSALNTGFQCDFMVWELP